MTLSEHEVRVLSALESATAASDPGFADRLTRGTPRPDGRDSASSLARGGFQWLILVGALMLFASAALVSLPFGAMGCVVLLFGILKWDAARRSQPAASWDVGRPPAD